MTLHRTIPAYFIALVILAGCASTKVTEREVLVNERLPRPNQILVYNFAFSPGDVPTNSALAGQYAASSVPLTTEEEQAERQLGAQIATELAGQIREMGLNAIAVPKGTPARVGDIVLKGYLLSVEEGGTGKRMIIGFGAGESELKVAVEGFQMTAQGLRKLGSGVVESGSGKSPGLIVPAAVAAATASPIGLIVMGGAKIYGEASGRNQIEGRAKATAKEIADVLKTKFEEQGWIN